MEHLGSVLTPTPQSLGFPMVLSIGLHGGLVCALAISAWLFTDDAPLVDVNDTIQVSMVVLPKSETPIPDRASRAPVPKGTSLAAETAPAPIKESDLTFDDPKAEATQGAVDRSADRARLLRQLQMKDLLADAPEGKVDRSQTDPNSTSDEAINAMGVGTLGDVEFARYQQQLQDLFRRHFNPLPTIVEKNPNISCAMKVKVDSSTGRITWHGISRSSGNMSYDAAAERAVRSVTSVPLPPSRFLPLLEQGFEIQFEP